MQSDMKILILAGTETDENMLLNLSSHTDAVVERFSEVSRGVRRLETVDADLVLLIPDSGDTSWKKAIRRVREEYDARAILLGRGGDDFEANAVEAGAYGAFDLDKMTGDCLPRRFMYLRRQAELEVALDRQQDSFDWLEKTGRLGSWQANGNGKVQWTDGLRRILEDDGQLTEDFSSVRQFVHPEDLDVFDQANKATFEQGWPLDFEYRIITGKGETRHLHVHRRVEYGDDGKVLRTIGMCRDVTPEREFENFLFRRDAILQVVGSFAEKCLREADWRSGLNDVLGSLGKAAEVTRTFIYRKDGKGLSDARFSMTHEWTDASTPPVKGEPFTQNQVYSPVFDRWKTILNSRKIVAGNVRSFQTHERQFFEKLETQSILLVPFFVGNEWWGFLGLTESREEREWMPGEIESMTMLADLFGAAILRGRMETLLKTANRSAEEARQVALEASLAKSRFLANMSHEIRTPISGILGMAEMTITTGLTTEQREHMDMIRDAARSLLSIVNDILDISKIEASKMELKTEDFELRPLLDTTLRSFTPVVEKKPLALNSSVAPDVPAFVHGDPDRLGQVLTNLVGNALKFTERGHVDVTVEVSDSEDGRICLLFCVEDSGEGISKDMLDTVFDSFTQADSSVRKKHQGTGLGLTISRELVQMMDGDIGVDSELGVGSTFSFTVWLGVPKKAERKSQVDPLIPQGMHLNILMAEDNPLNQKFLTHFLSMFGHTVTVAENGIKALEALERMGRDVDLILMDIQMPQMGGKETTRAIRKSDGKLYDPNIPIIALTAYAMKGDKEEMFEAGMDDYVSKPVDMKELSAAIARAVAERKSDKAKPAAAVGVTPSANGEGTSSVTVSLDMDSLIERFDGNMELLSEILELFLDEAEVKLKKLDEALEAGDAEELGAAIHSITNISSHVLAMDIVVQSRELEKRCYREPLADVAPGIRKLRPQFVALVAAVREKAKTL